MTDGDQNKTADVPVTTVFLSYSRDDQKRALPILNLLKAAGFSVWWDGMLTGGERFSRTTDAALSNAKAVVVLWSKTSINSHWVHDEATQGRDRGCLVPLSLDGSIPPLGFRQFQVIDAAAKRVKHSTPEMIGMLRAVATLHDQPFDEVIYPSARTPFVSRRVAIGGGLALAVAGGGITVFKGGLLGPGSLQNSVAVLPFANLSGDPAQSYFSDGLASEIRSQLSRNALLEIVGQTSSNQFRENKSGAKSIAKELGVSFLLDGNVQKIGDRVKIATDLIDGKTGISKWAQTFERQLSDIFAVQTEIARAVSSALSVAMDAKQSGHKEKQIGGTKSLAAFDAFLRGRELFELHVDEKSERDALAKIDQAIVLDPKYAAARALRSRSLAVIANQFASAQERKFLYKEAIAEAKNATEIAPKFAAGFAALGYALFYGNLDAKAARAPYEQAFALAKSDVDVISRFAVYCARTGRLAEADTAINRAAVLDPLNSSMFKSAGNIKYSAKLYEQAIEFGRKALALSPKRSTLHGDIGNSYLMLGAFDQALAEYGLETNSLIAIPGRAIIAHRQSDFAKSKAMFADLVEEYGDNSLYQQTQIFAQWGDLDGAFTTLDRAYAESDSGLVYLLNDPFLEPIRTDVRYKNLLLKLKFV